MYKEVLNVHMSAQSPMIEEKNTFALSQKHGISQGEVVGWSNGGNSEAAKQRFADFKKDAHEQEHVLTEELLASMPKQ